MEEKQTQAEHLEVTIERMDNGDALAMPDTTICFEHYERRKSYFDGQAWKREPNKTKPINRIEKEH